MSYSYRSPQTKPPIQPTLSTLPVQSQPTKQISKQQLKRYQSLFLITGYVVKANQNKKIKQTFTKIKTIIARRKKFSQLLVKRLNFLFKNKQRQFTNIFFSSLVANKISFYNNQMANQKVLKQNSKTSASGILFYALQKLFNKNFKTAFTELRTKSVAYSKARNFKTVHMLSKLSLMYRHKLEEGINRLAQNRIKALQKGKMFNKLENLFSLKNKRNTSTAFNVLKINLYRTKLNDSESPAPQPSKQDIKQSSKGLQNTQTGANKIQSERRQLQERSRQLQSQISQIQQGSSKNLTSLKNEISRLQKQNQSLHFNNDLLDQNNSELEREVHSKQLRARRKLPKNEIWENVYNNLIYFLAINKNKTITKEQLIQCLQTPLIPCNSNLQDLREENNVLAELLEEYKKSFPQPQNKSPQAEIALPYNLLKNKNRYYYMVLEVLSEWGLSGNKEFEQLNLDLEVLQKKLVE